MNEKMYPALFLKSYRTIMAQGQQAIDGGVCRYRSGNLKCGIGALIPNDKYRPEMENKPVQEAPGVIQAIFPGGFQQIDMYFLQELQGAHDLADQEDFLECYYSTMVQLDQRYKLNVLPDLSQPLQTTSGSSVRILCTDRKSSANKSIIGLVETDSGEEGILSWTFDGFANSNRAPSYYDLQNISAINDWYDEHIKDNKLLKLALKSKDDILQTLLKETGGENLLKQDFLSVINGRLSEE